MEADWMPEEAFKELEKIVWNEIEEKSRSEPGRELCVRETNYCTGCGRCKENEGAL